MWAWQHALMHKTKPLLPLLFFHSFQMEIALPQNQNNFYIIHSSIYQPPTAPKDEWNEESFLMFCFAPLRNETLLNEKVLSSNFLTLWQEHHHHLYTCRCVCLSVTEKFIISLLPCFFFISSQPIKLAIYVKKVALDINIELEDVIKICCMKHSWCIKNLLEWFDWKVQFQTEHNAVMKHSTCNIGDENIQQWMLKNIFFFSFLPFSSQYFRKFSHK
jgi:hypothetical protein